MMSCQLKSEKNKLNKIFVKWICRGIMISFLTLVVVVKWHSTVGNTSVYCRHW